MNDLLTLMKTDSLQEFKIQYDTLSGKSSQAMVKYFTNELKAGIHFHVAKFGSEPLDLYDLFSGV